MDPLQVDQKQLSFEIISFFLKRFEKGSHYVFLSVWKRLASDLL